MDCKILMKRLLIIGTLTGTVIGGSYVVASKYVGAYDGLAFPNTFINEVTVSEKTKSEIEAVISHQMTALSNREISILIDGQEQKINVADLKPIFNYEVEELATLIIENKKDLSILERLKLILEPSDYAHDLMFEVKDEEIIGLVNRLAEEFRVEPVEPTISKKGNSFTTTTEKTGLAVNKEELTQLLIETVKEQTSKPKTISIIREVVEPKHKESSLKAVNTPISTYSSQFDATISRAVNVVNASKKINGSWVMPGEEFSYNQYTLPANQSNGYTYGTIFVNGTTAQGLGGGMCQVSSTLYNTMLEAGILATQRKAHSLPVGYVPTGQDATMSDSGIDLKFVNTLEYPIYIESITNNGTLTITFWSHENALKGVDYQVHSKVYNNGYSADTTLYGYKNGKIVYQKFLHTSNYKIPK